MLVIVTDKPEEAEKLIKAEYLLSDVCIGELMEQIQISGLTMTQVVQVYASLYEDIEGDEVCRVDSNGMRYSIGT